MNATEIHSDSLICIGGRVEINNNKFQDRSNSQLPFPLKNTAYDSP